jgi:hypothetical protein
MNLLIFLRRPASEHFVDGGRVGCAVRGADVDVETCMACEHAVSVDLGANPPVVRCRGIDPCQRAPAARA